MNPILKYIYHEIADFSPDQVLKMKVKLNDKLSDVADLVKQVTSCAIEQQRYCLDLELGGIRPKGAEPISKSGIEAIRHI